MQKIFKIIIVCLIIILIFFLVGFCYLYFGKTHVSKGIIWGVDFSQSQAEYLKINWKEVYLSIIQDLGVKNIKLHTNWNWVEGKKDNYYFDDIDWQIKQAEQKGVKIIYVIGMKTGRWPECHIPLWVNNLSEQDQQKELIKYINQVVKRYKDSKAIIYWQVENEPLFKFGECPEWYYQNKDFLKEEVALVKSLDPSRKVIISDSGEQSTWFNAAEIGDIVGITMYRNVWAHVTNNLGFNLNYAILNPATYMRKAQIIQKVFGKNVVCIELQAEPWSAKPLMQASVEEQLKSMNLSIFKQDVEFAKSTGLDKFYFWGVEWWYWMKTTQNQPAIWNEAQKLFQK